MASQFATLLDGVGVGRIANRARPDRGDGEGEQGAGHEDVEGEGVLEDQGDNVVAKPSVLSYTEITDANRESFHFHGDSAGFPVHAALVEASARDVLEERHEPGDPRGVLREDEAPEAGGAPRCRQRTYGLCPVPPASR